MTPRADDHPERRGDVAAVVVRWRGGDEVARCLRSLIDHGGDRLSQVVLVDSGSGDGGAERLATEHPSAQVLALEENRSFAWAANQGVNLTSTPRILLLNPDTRILPGSVDRLARFLDRSPGCAGAVPLLLDPSGRPQHRWQLRHLPSISRLIAGVPGRPVYSRPPSTPAPVPQPAAAAWLIRRTVWNQLNGLDPSYEPAWWEDVDLCARLASLDQSTGEVMTSELAPENGFWVVPEARIEHQGGSSTVHLSHTQMLGIFYGNLARYASRHHHHRLNLIRCGLSLSLLLRAVIRPARALSYLGALSRVWSKHNVQHSSL